MTPEVISVSIFGVRFLPNMRKASQIEMSKILEKSKFRQFCDDMGDNRLNQLMWSPKNRVKLRIEGACCLQGTFMSQDERLRSLTNQIK